MYKRQGSKLLLEIIKYAESNADVDEMYLHVHITNEEALKFYQKFG